MKYKSLNWIALLAFGITISACGGGGGGADSDDNLSREDDPTLVDDVSIEDTPIDEIPDHQQGELQEYMFETAEFRTPVGNIYEVVADGEHYFIHFNETGYSDGMVEAYKFNTEQSCYRQTTGAEPNAALHLTKFQFSEMEGKFSETPTLTFHPDGFNSNRESYEQVSGKPVDEYTLMWLRDDYGFLNGFNVKIGDDLVGSYEDELLLEIPYADHIAVISLNLEPIDKDPSDFEQLCHEPLYGLFENTTPEHEFTDVDFDPYDSHPGYTIFIDERSYHSNNLSLDFNTKQPPHDNEIFAITLSYNEGLSCYRLLDQRYTFHYEPVADRYVYASWLNLVNPTDLVKVTLDLESSETPLALQTFDNSLAPEELKSGRSVYVPYKGQDRDNWSYQQIGLSLEPSSSVTLEDVSQMVCSGEIKL